MNCGMKSLCIKYIRGNEYLAFKYSKEDFDNLKDWVNKKEIKILTPPKVI